jgi:hypothetical protein
VNEFIHQNAPLVAALVLGLVGALASAIAASTRVPYPKVAAFFGVLAALFPVDAARIRAELLTLLGAGLQATSSKSQAPNALPEAQGSKDGPKQP